MKTITSPACSNDPFRFQYSIINDYCVNISISANPFNIPLDTLFTMAARKNKKRGFLFVSKVLGKHIPIDPGVSLLTGAALAVCYAEQVYGRSIPYKDEVVKGLCNHLNAREAYRAVRERKIDLPRETLFIGFAETATALGHAMFERFNKAAYVHTTREEISELEPVILFEEEHSHAVSHRLYLTDKNLLKGEKPVVLVDDELTTGQTVLNIIEAIQKEYPRMEYTVASILDWRTAPFRRKFKETEKRLGIRIHTVSLIKGEIEARGTPGMDPEAKDIDLAVQVQPEIDEILCPNLRPFTSHFSSKNLQTPYLSLTGRFGLTPKLQQALENQVKAIAGFLSEIRQGRRTLCLGTGEFMYIPMKIAREMGEGVLFQSTTRSPIHPHLKEGYAVQSAISFENPEDRATTNYFYNILPGRYDELFIFFERRGIDAASIMTAVSKLGIKKIHFVFFANEEDLLHRPEPMGSYAADEVTFLLKDLKDLIHERGTEDREEVIQSGGHYSEMLPIEYKPSEAYLRLFHHSLQESCDKLAAAVGVVAEAVINRKGSQIVLASLARAGTPVGILIKKYIEFRYRIEVPHYSISIIRGKGIDRNAVSYILQRHPGRDIQFVDGWTGKGTITRVLSTACRDFAAQFGFPLDDDLAVLADPGFCVKTFGTREDFLIPSACLNSTVSGLVSRTVHRDDLIGPKDYHGAKYYPELADEDVSRFFIDTVAARFPFIGETVDRMNREKKDSPSWQGLKDLQAIQRDYGIDDINLIKPGVGEATRVLLRRVPWKILIKTQDNPNLEHVLLLAKEKGVPVETYPEMSYSCCGLIKPLRADQILADQNLAGQTMADQIVEGRLP